MLQGMGCCQGTGAGGRQLVVASVSSAVIIMQTCPGERDVALILSDRQFCHWAIDSSATGRSTAQGEKQWQVRG